MQTLHINRQSIARSITASLGASRDLDALACGILQPGSYMPENEGQYWQFRRYMHDVFCMSLVDSGLFRDWEFGLKKIGVVSENKRLNTQKPDLYTLKDGLIHIGEVSITYNPDQAARDKQLAYKDLVEFLETSCGYSVRLDVLILDLTDPEWKESFPTISDLYISILDDFVLSLVAIHSNAKFGKVRKLELGSYNIDRFQYVIENKTIADQVEEATGVRADPEYIKNAFQFPGKEQWDDSQYIGVLASELLKRPFFERPTPEPRSIEPVSMLAEFDSLFKSPPTTRKCPRILQLGCPLEFVEEDVGFEQVVSSLRVCGRTGGYLDLILDSLERRSPDEESHFVKLSLSQEQLDREQMQGPGRKYYYKKHGITPPRDPPQHIGVKQEHTALLRSFIDEVDTSKLKPTIKELSIPDVDTMGFSVSLDLQWFEDRVLQHPTSGILMFYQRLSNEIVLNSMRRRRTGQYALSGTGCKDVYLLVAPGPQLRTESNVEFVRIISLREPVHSGLSMPWNPVGDHWESDWLSVDVDRLKHWQRAFDRVSLTLLVNSERLVRPGTSIRDAVKLELSTGNYTLMALTYLENKNLTSVTNQTLRYLWMKSIGDKDFKGLASKFPSRVNSIIQSHMLQTAVQTCAELCRKPLSELVQIKRLNRDDETGLYDEATTGITSLMPRLFTFGGPVPISYNLNEIYWCMMYNKDRQNAGQDSLRILDKIVREEYKYDKEIGKRSGMEKVDYLLGNTSVPQDLEHVFSDNPESHFFSARAVRIGLRSQDNHHENSGNGSSWMTSDKLERILSKPLSDYATFKASVKAICSKINRNDLAEVKKLGVRTKAVELIAEILTNEHLLTASELAMTFSGAANQSLEILIQIFKKGQIGGVREIIILWIKARVLINITEEVARLMCKSDKREILTKGRDKRLMMRGDFEEVVGAFPTGTPVQVIKESFDMTAWCQKFIPTIFPHIHIEHFKDHPGMVALAMHVFLAHSNKKIELPRKLVEQWSKNPEAKHDGKPMQAVKERFLQDGTTVFKNHSNMCQGIPHYQSSCLGLSSISFRDRLFRECLKQLGQECHISWKTRLGSDDKGTLIAVNLSQPTAHYQARLLSQCERAAERLHCMELSVKSASGLVMYELNSAFMANLETLSPTIKFSLAAVDVFETSSCSGFVQQSYSSIRQMRENGASSLSCAYAHGLNSNHFDKIFDTARGGVNCPMEIFGLRKSEIPYDFGVYPTYDCDIQDLVGPELHNYRILKKDPQNPALQLLYTSLSNVEESSESFPSEDENLLKKDHFGIRQGLVRQLTSMRSRVDCDPKEVEEWFTKNPFVLVRGPQTHVEALYLVKSKLCTRGAAQSLRRTSPAIYIGRLTAFRSSKAWSSYVTRLAGFNFETGSDIMLLDRVDQTYSEFLKTNLELNNTKNHKSRDLKTLTHLLHPNHQSLDVADQISGQFGVLTTSDKKFSQAVRNLKVNNFNYEFNSSLRSILTTAFGLSQDSSKEDVSELKKLVGLKFDSLDGFKEDCMSRGIRPLDMFFYLTRIHKLSKSSVVQAFLFGPSSPSLHKTLVNLKRYNHYPGATVTLSEEFPTDIIQQSNVVSRKHDLIKFSHNLLLMQITGTLRGTDDILDEFKVSGTSLRSLSQTLIRETKSISGMDFTTQKAFKLVASEVLDNNEFRDKLIDWKNLGYTYLTRQTKSISKSGKISWSGDLSVLVSSGNECFTLNEVSGNRFVTAKSVSDISDFNRALKSMCKTLGLELQSLLNRRPMKPGDIYMSQSTRNLHVSEVTTEQANVLKIKWEPRFKYKRVVDMVNQKTVREFNQKSHTLQVFLKDNQGRTSTVCHSLCNFYPVEIPRDVAYPDDSIKFQAVSLAALFENRDWFFNRRLTSMSMEQAVNFLRTRVDVKWMTELESEDISRVQAYLEVREEVNEDAFTIMRAKKKLDTFTGESSLLDNRPIRELFREAMVAESRVDRSGLYKSDLNDWAEEVELEENDLNEAFGEALNDDETVLVTRAFGYSKRKQQKQSYTINTLQQGSEMKNRVLNLFFKFGSIKSESVRDLPGIFSWLQLSCKLSDSTRTSLTGLVCKTLASHTGSDEGAVATMLTTNLHRIAQVPLPVADWLQSPEGTYISGDQVLSEIYQSTEDYQEQVSDDEGMD